jgi:hypothetical protein
MTTTASPQIIAFALAEDLLKANAEMEKWKAFKESVTTKLTELHSAGQIPTKFTANGHTFTLQSGRRTVELDAEGKEQLNSYRASLEAEGHGTAKTGDSFWVPRKDKVKAKS